MERDELRNYVQNYTLDQWVLNGYRGFGLISMGVGKSRIMAMAIVRYLQDHPEFDYLAYDHPIVIVVNSSDLRDREIPKELKKWKVRIKVKMVCYQTAYRWKKKIGLLLADEVDFALSEGQRYLQVFTKCTYDAYLALTGTLVEKKQDILTSVFGLQPFVHFPLSEAQRYGLINQTSIWVHEVPLTHEKYPGAPYGEVSKYKWISQKIQEMKDNLSAFYDYLRGSKLSYEQRAAVSDKLQILRNQKEYWESRKSNPNNRMSMMHTARSLSDYAKLLKDMILASSINCKVIVFGELTSEIDKITGYAYHGKKSDGDIIELFNSGEVREVGVVRKVNRGVNFEDLNNAIIHSYTSSVTNAAQAYIGRLVRLDPSEVASIHFLVSYYLDEDGEKIYCQNHEWVTGIFNSKELEHLTLNYFDGASLQKNLS